MTTKRRRLTPSLSASVTGKVAGPPLPWGIAVADVGRTPFGRTDGYRRRTAGQRIDGGLGCGGRRDGQTPGERV